MNKFIGVLFLGFCCHISLAQVGIYTEDDIALQSQYLSSELAKYQLNPEEQQKALKTAIEEDRSNHAAYYQLARLELNNNDYKTALTHIEKAISLQSSNKWYYLLAADICQLQLDFKGANGFIDKAIQLEPNNTTLKYRLSNNFLKNGNPEKAINALKEIENQIGINEKTSYLQLDILNETKQYAQSIEVLEKLIAIYPKNVSHLNNLANQYILLGDEKKATALREKILSIDPDNVEANIAQLQKNNTDTSEDSQYLFAIKPLISNQAIPFDEKIRELIPYVEQINTQDKGATDALRAISETLVANYPDEAKAHALKGDIMYITGASEAALKSYDKTLSLNDRVYSVWAQKLEVLYTLSKYEELQSFAEKTIDYYPNQFDAYYWYQLSSIMLNKIKDSTVFEEEMSFMTGNNQVMKNKAVVVNALKNLKENNPKEAMSQISSLDSEYLKSDPFIAEIYGDILAANGSTEQALKYWKISKNIGNTSIRVNEKIQ